MTYRELMQQALEALEDMLGWESLAPQSVQASSKQSLQRLREALAHPEQEPVAWMDREGDLYKMPEIEGWAPPHTLLYTAPPQHQADPVVWQFRMRPDWVRDKDFWEPWTNCTKEQAANYQRVPHLHDWTYESRSLYTAPPQRKPLTDAEILKAWKPYEGNAFTTKYEFARAIERAHGIGGEE